MKDPTRYHVIDYVREKLKEECPPIVGMFYPGKVAIYINSPELVEEVYISKNAYFDKHDSTADILSRLVKHSLVFTKTGPVWQA